MTFYDEGMALLRELAVVPVDLRPPRGVNDLIERARTLVLRVERAAASETVHTCTVCFRHHVPEPCCRGCDCGVVEDAALESPPARCSCCGNSLKAPYAYCGCGEVPTAVGYHEAELHDELRLGK